MRYSKEQEERREEVIEAARKFMSVLARRPGENVQSFPGGMTYTEKTANFAASLLAEDGNFRVWFPFEGVDKNGKHCIYDNLGDEVAAELARLEKDVDKAIEEVAWLENYQVSESKELIIDVWPSRDDVLSGKEIAQIFAQKNGKDAFRQTVREHLNFAYDMDAAYDKVMDAMREINPDTDKYAGCVEVWVRDRIKADIPYDYYAKQPVDTVISVDTGDADFGFTPNMYLYYERDDSSTKYASIAWLAATQGYDELALRCALHKGDHEDPEGFLETLTVECANAGSDAEALILIAKMPLSDLIDLNEKITEANGGHGVKSDPSARLDVGCIHVDKDVTWALYNPQDGGGSLIVYGGLERDFNLPVKYIHTALPDGCWGDWSVRDTYSVSGSLLFKEGMIAC